MATRPTPPNEETAMTMAFRSRARVLKVGGAESPESYSNYAMTGK